MSAFERAEGVDGQTLPEWGGKEKKRKKGRKEQNRVHSIRRGKLSYLSLNRGIAVVFLIYGAGVVANFRPKIQNRLSHVFARQGGRIR